MRLVMCHSKLRIFSPSIGRSARLPTPLWVGPTEKPQSDNKLIYVCRRRRWTPALLSNGGVALEATKAVWRCVGVRNSCNNRVTVLKKRRLLPCAYNMSASKVTYTLCWEARYLYCTCTCQSWTWVRFSRPNPIQSMNFMDPILSNLEIHNLRPIQSINI